MVKISWLELLCERLQSSGKLGDVLGAVISVNVPFFVLNYISGYGSSKVELPADWQELSDLEKILQQPPECALMAFAVAEPNWQGKIANIKSHIEQKNSSQNDEKNFAVVNKTYVMNSRHQFYVCKSWHNDRLLMVRFQDELSQFTQREDPHSSFECSNGHTLRHYKVQFGREVPAQESVELDIRRYKVMAIEILRREFSSLSVLLCAELEFLGIALPDEIIESRDVIVEARRDVMAKIDKNILSATQNIFQYAQNKITLPDDLHPFWQWAIENYRISIYRQ